MTDKKVVDIYILGKKYTVPNTLTIMESMEYAGYQLKRGCGCRSGFCGACATVYRVNDEIGTFVAVEDRYFGLIPKSECFEEYSVGDELTLRVTRVREDKKLDLSPRKLLSDQMESDAELVLGKMRLLKEHFRFNDNSSAEDIKDYFGISKKAFKRAIGSLLKNGLIEKSGDYFTLKK